MTDEIYCYPPNYRILRNKFGLLDANKLNLEERNRVTDRILEGCPNGDFDLAHLKSIHHHLFQDVYDWAGQTRQLEISKGPTQFMPRQFIETGINDIHQRIVSDNYLKDKSPEAFAHKAGELIGDLNHAHPFREGNGRTQMQYLKQLAENAGHPIDLRKIDADQWIAASIRSNDADYSLMQDSIFAALDGSKLTAPQISQEQFEANYNDNLSTSAQAEQDLDQDHELE